MKKCFFVVDDDPFFRTLIERRFSGDNVIVKSFATGEECISSLKNKPDLIILDYIFSNDSAYHDGIAIFNEIKKQNTAIPVIMVSGQDDGEIVLELARMGMTDYVVKDKDVVASLEAAISHIFVD